MGRPPIGPRAMTGAERVQRHRARLRGNASTSPDHGDLELARQRAENAALLRDVALGARFAGSNRNRPAKPKAPRCPSSPGRASRNRQAPVMVRKTNWSRRFVHSIAALDGSRIVELQDVVTYMLGDRRSARTGAVN